MNTVSQDGRSRSYYRISVVDDSIPEPAPECAAETAPEG